MDEFSVGARYWDHHRLSFNYKHPWINSTASKTPARIIVHNNFLATKEAKVYRFKESLMWLIDSDGYYSNRYEKYIMFDNPYIRHFSNQRVRQNSRVSPVETQGALLFWSMRSLKLCTLSECRVRVHFLLQGSKFCSLPALLIYAPVHYAE